MASYRVFYNNQEIGPMDLNQLRYYNVTPNSMIRVDDGPWVPAYSVPEVMAAIGGQSAGFGSSTGKDHTVAGIFALLLGGFGIQYFYIGKTSAGIFTILLSIFTCGIWEIINVIQGILMLTMSQEDFNRKYVNNPATFPIF